MENKYLNSFNEFCSKLPHELANSYYFKKVFFKASYIFFCAQQIDNNNHGLKEDETKVDEVVFDCENGFSLTCFRNDWADSLEVSNANGSLTISYQGYSVFDTCEISEKNGVIYSRFDSSDGFGIESEFFGGLERYRNVVYKDAQEEYSYIGAISQEVLEDLNYDIKVFTNKHGKGVPRHSNMFVLERTSNNQREHFLIGIQGAEFNIFGNTLDGIRPKELMDIPNVTIKHPARNFILDIKENAYDLLLLSSLGMNDEDVVKKELV